MEVVIGREGMNGANCGGVRYSGGGYRDGRQHPAKISDFSRPGGPKSRAVHQSGRPP